MWAVGSVLPRESRQTGLKLGKEAGRSHRKRRQEGATGKDSHSGWSSPGPTPRQVDQGGARVRSGATKTTPHRCACLLANQRGRSDNPWESPSLCA